MKQSAAFLTVLLLLAGVATAEYSAVLSLRPAVDGACVAVEVPTPNGAGLSGLRWFHNDADVAFPRLVLLEGQPGVPPALEDPGLILLEIAGASLAWGEVDFGGPVTSSTGTAYAVLCFPVGLTTDHLGQGGGPGIGIREAADAVPFYLTADAQQWVRFDPAYEIAIEPVYAQGKTSPRVLGEMRGEERPTPEAATTPAYVTALLPPHPNPFNPRVEIAYTMAAAGHVQLAIYDVRGRAVKVLLAEDRPAGESRVTWDGTDVRGLPVASGVYFARMEALGTVALRRLALMR